MQFDHKSGKHIKVDDAQIYYEELGDKKNPIILLLHGGMNTLELFNTLLKELPNDFPYRLIAIDSRGHGKSTLGNYELSYALLQKEVEVVLQHLEVKKFSILGFSNGGNIAYRLAAFTNLDIEKIVTISAPWHNKYAEPLFPAYANIPVEAWQQQCPDDFEVYQRVNPKPDIKELFKNALQMGLDTSEDGRPNKAVQNITCDVLAIRGEKDPLVPKESMKEFCNLVKKAKAITVSGAGHEVIAEQPKAVADELIKFYKIVNE